MYLSLPAPVAIAYSVFLATFLHWLTQNKTTTSLCIYVFSKKIITLLFLDKKQSFPTLCVAPEAMVPKVLINPQFSFGEMSKTASDMKENLDDICKKEMGKLSKTGLFQQSLLTLQLPFTGSLVFAAI